MGIDGMHVGREQWSYRRPEEDASSSAAGPQRLPDLGSAWASTIIPEGVGRWLSVAIRLNERGVRTICGGDGLRRTCANWWVGLRDRPDFTALPREQAINGASDDPGYWLRAHP